MDQRNTIYLLGLSLVAVVGMLLKALTISPVDTRSNKDNLLSQVTPMLNQKGFDLASIRQPTSDKNFSIGIYKNNQCPGYLLLLPLQRNSEAAHLLGASFPGLRGEIYFVLKGKKYQKFPTGLFWWHHLLSGITGSNTKAPLVWAVSKTSSCMDGVSIHQSL